MSAILKNSTIEDLFALARHNLARAESSHKFGRAHDVAPRMAEVVLIADELKQRCEPKEG